jgi:hypothetical protein
MAVRWWWLGGLVVALIGCASGRGELRDAEIATLSPNHREEVNLARRHVEEAEADVDEAKIFLLAANKFLTEAISPPSRVAYGRGLVQLGDARLRMSRERLALEHARLKRAEVLALHAEGRPCDLTEAPPRETIDAASSRLTSLRQQVASLEANVERLRQTSATEARVADAPAAETPAAETPAAETPAAAAEAPATETEDQPAAETPDAAAPASAPAP